MRGEVLKKLFDVLAKLLPEVNAVVDRDGISIKVHLQPGLHA